MHPATRSGSGELEKEVEDDRKAEAAEAAQDPHKTADHAPGLEVTLAKICGREIMDRPMMLERVATLFTFDRRSTK
jgi:hypothetical protein